LWLQRGSEKSSAFRDIADIEQFQLIQVEEAVRGIPLSIVASAGLGHAAVWL
jgi:hypothetical protein